MKRFKQKNQRDNLYFEDVITDKQVRDFETIEMPLAGAAFYIMKIIIVLFLLVLSVRIVFLTTYRGNFYSYRAHANSNREVERSAPRGIIFDRFETPLVQDVPGFSLQVRLSEFRKDPDILSRISEILNRAISLDEIIRNADIERSDIVTISRALSLTEVAQLRSINSRAIVIEDSYQRLYTAGAAFSHILGYVGPVSKEELVQNAELSHNDIVGKDGLELFYDEQLRGEKGSAITYYNSRGAIVEEKKSTPSYAGNALITTIDAGLQRFLYEQMSKQVAALGARGGVAIAMDFHGGVRALVSIPGFDNNIFIDEKRNEERILLLKSQRENLFNRAISGLYSPGSTIKPLVGVAALSENILTPDKKFFSPGYLELPNPYNPDSPSRFLDWRAHGWVDLRSAIARSSNVYFYYAGGGYPVKESDRAFRGLGIEKLREYWSMFLLGKKTEIDFPGEANGLLPDPAKQEWRVGDTYNVSIGQGDLLISPIQLLDYIIAIANKGIIYRPHMLRDTEPEVLANLSALANEMEEVEMGMRDAVSRPYGTAHSLANLPIPIAAKTGSAQILNNTKTNAFFVGYTALPSQSDTAEGTPIALLVIIEDAREGSVNTIPVARDTFLWYYENRILNDVTETE